MKVGYAKQPLTTWEYRALMCFGGIGLVSTVAGGIYITALAASVLWRYM